MSANQDNLTNAIWNLLLQKTLPPENVIQVLQLYLKDDRLVGSQLLMEKIILFYLNQDRIDVWNLIGTQYTSSAGPVKEVSLDFLDHFHDHFKKNVQEMIYRKKLQKKFRAKINF